MFTISPIGSCRITTPLKKGQSRHGVRLNVKRCYGYCHSPAEAVQMARFMRGEAHIPEELWPLVSRSHDLNALSEQRHTPSNLYIVELSSAKEITVDGISVQLNYLRLAFDSFFADAQRTQSFWELAQIDDPTKLRAFLDREWSGTATQRRDAKTLGRIRLRHVTRSSLRRDMNSLAILLPDVLFVTHVDACKPDGTKIGSRSAFIELVRTEATAHGYNVYDPTELMEEFGQAAAIEDHSTSLAHYTEEFGNALMDEWMRAYIAPSTDRIVSNSADSIVTKLLRPQANAAIARGQTNSIVTRLKSLAEASNDVDHLLCEAELEQTRALELLKRRLASTDALTLSIAEVCRIADEAANLGAFDLAIDFAARSSDGLHSLSAHQLTRIGLQAAEAGKMADAFELALAAFFQNAKLPRVRALLIELALSQNFNLLDVLPDAEASEMAAALDVEEQIRLLDLSGMSPSDIISEEWSATEVLDTASCLADLGRLEQAAQLLGAWRRIHEHSRIRDEALVALIDEWVAGARALEHTAERIRALITLTEACPRHAELRTAVRDTKLDLVERIRAAGKDGNLEQLEDLAVEVRAFPSPIPEFDLWRARVLFDRGRFSDVIDLSPIASEHMTDRIGVWVLLMRAAIKAAEPQKAVEFAARVVELATSKTLKLKIEAEAVLESETARA